VSNFHTHRITTFVLLALSCNMPIDDKAVTGKKR